MKISSKASRYISSRRGETRFAPYSLKNKFGNSDQMYIDNAQSKKRLNKPGSSTVGGKANNRFQDLDYSYERMQMSDRLLDMNPAPPPYSDTIIRWDLDVNPQVPVPQFTFDAYEDPDKENPEKEDPSKDEPIPPTEQKEMTKEEWEAAFKNNDKGTYDLYLYTNYYLYTDGKYHVMDEGTYDFFSKYMHFEDNYGYDNPWFNKDTPFKLVEFKNETEGIVYMQFHFLKDGEEYYFSMPVDTYDPRNNEGTGTSTPQDPTDTDNNSKDPVPDADPNSTTGYDLSDTTLTDEQWNEKYTNEYNDLIVPKHSLVKDSSGQYTQTQAQTILTIDPSVISNMTYGSELPSTIQLYHPGDTMTYWLQDYLKHNDLETYNKTYYSLANALNGWSFVNETMEDGSIVSSVALFYKNSYEPTKSRFQEYIDFGSVQTSRKQPLTSASNQNVTGAHLDFFEVPRRQFNIDKGVWSGQYMDPSNGKFWLPTKYTITSREFINWVNDYLRFFDPTHTPFTYGTTHVTEVSFESGIYRIYYKNGNSNKRYNIVIPRSENQKL